MCCFALNYGNNLIRNKEKKKFALWKESLFDSFYQCLIHLGHFNSAEVTVVVVLLLSLGSQSVCGLVPIRLHSVHRILQTRATGEGGHSTPPRGSSRPGWRPRVSCIAW